MSIGVDFAVSIARGISCFPLSHSRSLSLSLSLFLSLSLCVSLSLSLLSLSTLSLYSLSLSLLSLSLSRTRTALRRRLTRHGRVRPRLGPFGVAVLRTAVAGVHPRASDRF